MTEEIRKLEVTNAQLKVTENYLNSYKFCRRMLDLKNYEQKYFDTLEWEKENPAEFALARAKMYEVRHFLLDLPNSEAKLLLYYHFVRGETVEYCAELLGVSRSSAFRLKKRGLELAYKYSLSIGKDLEKDKF